MYSTDFFALGVNERGNITPLCSSMSIFMTYIDENGEEKFRDRVRTSSDGLKGMGWNPFHHHTVSRVPQNCDQCHPVVPGSAPDNFDILRETYGFGRKRYVGTDGDGVEHDMGAFLDEDGNLMSDFPHPNTGPVPREIRERAMSIDESATADIRVKRCRHPTAYELTAEESTAPSLSWYTTSSVTVSANTGT